MKKLENDRLISHFNSLDFSWSASVFVEVNLFYPEESDYNALQSEYDVIFIFIFGHVAAYFLFILDLQNNNNKKPEVVHSSRNCSH